LVDGFEILLLLDKYWQLDELGILVVASANPITISDGDSPQQFQYKPNPQWQNPLALMNLKLTIS
jgi:hypothetical protein